MKGLAGILVLIAAGLMASEPLAAYLKRGVRVESRIVSLRWRDLPVRYFVANRGTDGVTASEFQSAVARAFRTWEAVETAELSSEFVGFTGAVPGDEDDMSVLGYVSRPDQSRVLAATTTLYDGQDGRILESDIYFNSSFLWSTSQTGTAGRFDVESIALHEIGHLLGLSHSALGETELAGSGRRVIAAETVMFPIAFAAGSISDRTLKADDVAGISDIYGTATFRRRSGSISGKVTMNGQGVPGAHVTAFNPRTGEQVGGFSLNEDGSFVIAALAPGPHVLRVEPLDDGDIESFFDDSLDVEVDFQPRFYERIVAVPRGGGTANVEIKVTPK